MGEIVVLRHGQTEWSRSGQHTSVTDLPLLPEGEEQARALRTSLAGRSFSDVWVSPRQRARHTAELAGLTATAIDEDLVEMDYGRYEGRTTADISAELGRTWSVWQDGGPAGSPGESPADVGVRVDRVLDRVRARLADGDVALVAHGHVLRILTARWLRLPAADGRLFALDTGTVSTLGTEHDRPVITSWNVPAHRGVEVESRSPRPRVGRSVEPDQGRMPA